MIPSFDFLNQTKLNPINDDLTFFIEVSNNGKDFSDSKKLFKFIPNDQLISVSPTNGPEEGGTVLNITIIDLPYTSGKSGDIVDIARCHFPGYPP